MVRAFLSCGTGNPGHLRPVAVDGICPAAVLTAQIARPDATVAALAGDGGFAMPAMEFATAVQHDLPVIVLVCSNGLLGEEAAKQSRAGLPVYGMKLHNPDWAAFARAAGGSDGTRKTSGS
ncbi:MAG: thiamine pyrophosphate-dependent enzyme [Clostridia bacterium]